LAGQVGWHKKYTKVLDDSDPYLHRWFPDGEINIAWNCLDRHVKEGLGGLIAFFEESAYTGHKRAWNYQEVLDHSGRLASVFRKKFGVEKGDRVVIYMPMVIEAAFAMLACARLGAIHSVVFGGFAPKELASRIDDCRPKLIVTASYGIEPGKQIPYVPIVEEAIGHCKIDCAKSIPRLIKQRTELDGKLLAKDLNEFYHDYSALMAEEHEVQEAVPVPSNHPLYILYTSGTTGAPKGIVRDQGGCTVMLNWSMSSVFNLHRHDRFFATSDIGWVVGHSFIVYGPLLRGATSVFFEGKPITPNPGKVWEMCQNYRAKVLYIAPTGLRIVKKLDYDGEWPKKYDLSSIESIGVVGERCDPDTIKWVHRIVPHALINDTWWQTESGVPMCCNLLNIKEFGPMYPTLPGSVTRPVPGYDIRIFDEANEEVKNGVLGKVVIKMPMPPTFMLTLWGNDAAFIAKYLEETPGYYTTGDAGWKDEHGYVHIMTRVDDVINTSGHRLSTGRLEEAVNETPGVVESAVVGYNDPLRGECPLAFVVLKGANWMDRPEKELN
jgi:propionyl-CoA synthetase